MTSVSLDSSLPRTVSPQSPQTMPLGAYDAFLEIFDPTSIPGTETPSLIGRVGEFFNAIGRAITNLFCGAVANPSATGEAPRANPTGIITADLIARQRLGWGNPDLTVEALERLSRDYRGTLIDLFGPNPDFTNWLADVHNRSGLRDSEVDVTIRRALATLRKDGHNVEPFANALKIAVNVFRYQRLVQHLNDGRRVRMEEQPSSVDGNCFLTSCANGLRRITNGAETIGVIALKGQMCAQFDGLISERSADAKAFREQMILTFVGNESIAGRVVPDYETIDDWEQALFNQYSDEEIAEQDIAGIQHMIQELPNEAFAIKQGDITDAEIEGFRAKLSCPQEEIHEYAPWERAVLNYYYRQKRGASKCRSLTAGGQREAKERLLIDLENNVTHAMEQLRNQNKQRVIARLPDAATKLKNKANTRYIYQFHAELSPSGHDTPWELQLFTEHGRDRVLAEANDQRLLVAMREKGVHGDDAELIRKRDLFRARVRAICGTYRRALATPRLHNGVLEAVLAARALRRPIVVLKRRDIVQGGQRRYHWVYRTIAGKEFLPPLDRLQESPPLTLLHVRGHWTTGYYPAPAPIRA